VENGITLSEQIREVFGRSAVPPGAMSPLTLAFVGDAVYTLVIATMVVDQGNASNEKLHNKTEKLVSARAQAGAVKRIEEAEILTQEEKDILRRGINAKPRSHAKNASLTEYHRATGLEALIGYLYLSGRQERLIEIVAYGAGVFEPGTGQIRASDF